MKLWTVQHEAVFAELESSGSYRANWSRVQSNWRPAYRWMSAQTKRRVADSEVCSEAPPIWAWHSCSGWQRRPDRSVFDAMFGLDDPVVLSQHQVVGLLDVPDESACLSFYGPWCELFMPESGIFKPEDSLVAKLWCDSSIPPDASHWEPGSDYGDIQATLGSIKREQILELNAAADFFQIAN